LTLEFRKLKGSFLRILLPAAFLLPIIMVLFQYGSSSQNGLAPIVSKYCAIIQMMSFVCVVVSGCYIITMEYRNHMIPYLAVTPKSITKVLLCKYAVLLIETILLQLAVFIALFIMNTALSGFDANLAARYLAAGVLSTFCFFCITPAVVYVALWRRSFASSALIFLILFMLSFPFSFLDFGWLFPHLLPIMLVPKFLGFKAYAQIGYGVGISVLVATFVLFFYLSIRKIAKKE
jgi:hypothetical protein